MRHRDMTESEMAPVREEIVEWKYMYNVFDIFILVSVTGDLKDARI